MKFIVNSRYSLYTLLIIFSLPVWAQNQEVNPLHLFNTGVNMGHLNQHQKNNSSREQYGTWAANASGEWLASWISGTVTPITPDIEDPATAHDEYIKAMKNMPPCLNGYFQARISLYKAGFHLGNAMVETGTSCSQCLQLEMQKAAVELRTIASLTGKSVYAELSNSLNANASNLKMTYDDELAKQQNQGMSELINSTIKAVQNELPDEMVYCSTEKPTPKTEATEQKPEEDKKKRAFLLKAGVNNAYLKGDQGSKTDGKSGFLVGFDMYKGNPVYFAIGVKFFKNATGEELMIPLPGQIVDTDNYFIQGFTFGVGLGGYLYQKDDIAVTATAKLNYIITHAINGNLTSVGDTKVSDGVFQLEAGLGISWKILFVELTYEPGLSEALTSGNEKFKYRMLNFSAGLRF